jgi:hypothetical protein
MIDDTKKLVGLGVSLLVMLTLGTFACDSDTTSPSPVAGPSQGVELTGTVTSPGGQASELVALPQRDFSGMTVKVKGAGMSAEVDANGLFTLQGLPEGRFTLRFIDEDDKRIGDLTFRNVSPDQQITIMVQVSGNGVTLLEERRNGELQEDSASDDASEDASEDDDSEDDSADDDGSESSEDGSSDSGG